MIEVNTFFNFNPVNMLFNDNQNSSLMQSHKVSGDSFADVLNNTVQEKTAEPAQNDSYTVNSDNQDAEQQTQNTDQTQNSGQVQNTDQTQNAANQNNKVNNQDDPNQKVVKKEGTDQKNNGKEDKFRSLSDKDKAIVKEIADKLNIKPEALMNLLQTLNIDFKSLMQNSANLEQALQKVTKAVENTVQKLNLNLTAAGNNNIMAKIQILLNQQKQTAAKGESENQNVNLNLKISDDADKKQMDLQKVDVKLLNNQDKTSKADVQPQQHIGLPNKDEKLQTENRVKVDISKEFEKNAISQKSDKGSGELNSNQQAPQEDAGKGAVKSSDKVDMSAVLSNIKVINLKTAANNGSNTDVTKIDTQNMLPMQKFEGLTDKAIPLKQAIQNLNIQKDNIFSQVVENAKLILSDKQTEMEMNLKPENLGKLSIKIATENGLVMAKITTENEQVKAAIESNLGQLKEQLQQQGLSVQDFSVSVGQDHKQQLFSNQNMRSNATKLQGLGQSTIAANESYINRIMIKNPYLISDSSVDYTA